MFYSILVKKSLQNITSICNLLLLTVITLTPLCLGLIASSIGSIFANLLIGLITVENLIVNPFTHTWCLHKPNCNKYLHFCWSILQVGEGSLHTWISLPPSLIASILIIGLFLPYLVKSCDSHNLPWFLLCFFHQFVIAHPLSIGDCFTLYKAIKEIP